MRIVLAPNSTGSGHNMRMLAVARGLRRRLPEAELLVLLGSLQPTFTPLFEEAGVTVVDAVGHHVDYAVSSHLGREMDWNTYVRQYAAPAFVSGDKVLNHLAHYRDLDPDLVISDYNISASMAAAILGVPHALVTERYDFTLCQLDDDTLRAGGFTVDTEDMRRARESLHALFSWIVDSAELVITDKPMVPELDAGTPVAAALERGTAVFTGPVVRDFPARSDGAEVRRRLGLGDGPVIVGSVGGTTMFAENRERIIEDYVAAYDLLKRDRPDLQLVLLTRDGATVPEHVVTLSYLPDWMPLLQEADLLLSAPGWITVTEVSAMRIPTLFVLSGMGEYHEVEAVRRLAKLGFPTLVAPRVPELAQAIAPLLGGAAAEQVERASRTIAPAGSGTERAVGLLAEAAVRATARRALRNADLDAA
ncbi:hypothetical protein [Streptomyces sp. VRA16 Mangrove soil]|uniref:hypothetical protein n=1 Tax=Streptomyces sp. VRA16 Mangrove soil TaxID=2817434 RepID=UPI001A9DB3C9|nr:hypothetical protein [Streptomyces sp. VRA16 Mangrove soil]MBO1337165.1 hypothetical protein [Streptomyces sp. VRA16 Mangrove soil]